jgi:hypothetical protein
MPFALQVSTNEKRLALARKPIKVDNVLVA